MNELVVFNECNIFIHILKYLELPSKINFVISQKKFMIRYMPDLIMMLAHSEYDVSQIYKLCSVKSHNAILEEFYDLAEIRNINYLYYLWNFILKRQTPQFFASKTNGEKQIGTLLKEQNQIFFNKIIVSAEYVYSCCLSNNTNGPISTKLANELEKYKPLCLKFVCIDICKTSYRNLDFILTSIIYKCIFKSVEHLIIHSPCTQNHYCYDKFKYILFGTPLNNIKILEFVDLNEVDSNFILDFNYEFSLAPAVEIINKIPEAWMSYTSCQIEKIILPKNYKGTIDYLPPSVKELHMGNNTIVSDVILSPTSGIIIKKYD